MQALANCGAGFLLAVLWFDLMFDIQVRTYRQVEIPDHVLTSISTYYKRVTTEARPMNRLISGVMLITLLAMTTQWINGDLPAWRAGTSLLLTIAAIGLAGVRTVKNAVKFSKAIGTAGQQSHLARLIFADHLFCLGAIFCALILQLLPFQVG